MIDVFLTDAPERADLISTLLSHKEVHHIHLLRPVPPEGETPAPAGEDDRLSVLPAQSLGSSKTLRAISHEAQAPYTLLCLSPHRVSLAYRALPRLLQALQDSGAPLVYSDRYEATPTGTLPHPVIDYQRGSLRSDFDFGALWLLPTGLLHDFISWRGSARFRYAAPYALRLFLTRRGTPLHLPELLYTEGETDLRTSGEKQFDYVSPAQQEVGLEQERACTDHLKLIGAWLAPDELDSLPPDEGQDEAGTPWPVEASVVIPVRNRRRTIQDAVRSALCQQTDFPFNVLVVDNHSTDGTAEAVAELAAADPRVVLLRPEAKDLGIGGCWDLAIRHPQCGRYAVQLDSDDLYSAPTTLARIVDCFQRQRAAMVIGAYRMVDFQLHTLPPGLIAHTEWTNENGRNNALRVNGLGAPRAFRTRLLRQIGFPNTSYGEDYALGLAFSRRYRIGRIYDELYLCRRWEGNSDSALPLERVNANNRYKDRLRTIEIEARAQMNEAWNRRPTEQQVYSFIRQQLSLWPEVARRFEELSPETSAPGATQQAGEAPAATDGQHHISRRELDLDSYQLCAQFNPRRIVSTGAKMDPRAIKKRPCFLCEANRPPQQLTLTAFGHLALLVNPFPILPRHLTLPLRRHKPQQLSHFLGELCHLCWALPDMLFFYNGPRCGASAPDHAHLQAGARGIVPLERDWRQYATHLEKVYPLAGEDSVLLEEQGFSHPDAGIYLLRGYACPAFVLLGLTDQTPPTLLETLLSLLPVSQGQTLPDINLLAWRQQGSPAEADAIVQVVFVRRKHRPDCYHAEPPRQLLVSPGALDMGGLLVTPRREDYQRLTPRMAADILRECSITERQAEAIGRRLSPRHTARAARAPYPSSADTARAAGALCTAHSTLPVRRAPHAAGTPQSEPLVEVGIMSADHISFTLQGEFTAKGASVTGSHEVTCQDGGILWGGRVYSELTFRPAAAAALLTLHQVPFGKDFHWQRREDLQFRGTLHLTVDEGQLVAINQVPLEDYLTSVISSEMRSTSSLELLRSHAVISRSWLLHKMEQRRSAEGRGAGFFTFQRKDDEYIRWYDREDHTLFDVCADDHCQRYQGVTRAATPAALQAVRSTRGQVLTFDGHVCDARFSKCCGGVTERFSTCWDDQEKPYLLPVADSPDAPLQPSGTLPLRPALPLTTSEDALSAFILSSPEAWCNTHDHALLAQVLNDYDLETTPDFFRWKVSYTQQQLAELIASKREEDFGGIVDLQPLARGESGRICRLRIVGQKKTMVIGKELEIRRTLSPTHLLSSAFVVERGAEGPDGLPASFTLHGAGWGHGVGLCQIGAAVMASQGHDYRHILAHYYRQAELTTLYD